MTIDTDTSCYFLKNIDGGFIGSEFPAEFWNLVGTEMEEVRRTHDVEVNNMIAKRIYDELAAVAIPYICKLRGVTPDDIDLLRFEFDWDEIGTFTDEVNYMYNIKIVAPTEESQIAIDEMLKAEPTLNYSGSRERYYNSSDFGEFEDWQEAYNRDIKSHYIEPVAKRFGLDTNDFEIRKFDWECY